MIHTVFPIYNDINNQTVNLGYHKGFRRSLYTIKTKLLPFQFATDSGESISNIYLYDYHTGSQIVDLEPYLATGQLINKSFSSPSKEYFMHLGSANLDGYTMEEGDYYLRIVTTGGNYYSEVFSVLGEQRATIPRNYFSITFSNSKDIEDNEPICYQDNFAQMIRLKADEKGNKSRLIENNVEKDGQIMLRSMVVQEIKSVRAIVSKQVYKGLIRLPLHDSIFIQDRYDPDGAYVKNVKVGDPEWFDGGAYGQVTIEYVKETAVNKNTNINLS